MNRRSRRIMVPKKNQYYWLAKARDKATLSDESQVSGSQRTLNGSAASHTER